MRRREPARSHQPPTIGILSPGEMGCALGSILRSRGFEIVTTLAGRSERSADRCGTAGFEVFDSIGEVVARSDVLVSVVPPAAATSLAQRVAIELAERRRPLIYLDCNSVSPATMARVSMILEGLEVSLVDGGIHGLASRLATDGTLYLSGPDAEEVAALLGDPPRILVLGDRVGRASLLKMLISGVNKGLVALMLELSDVALRSSILDVFWAECRAQYPSVQESFERLLPTYLTHVGRRIEEMAELEQTVRPAGVEPMMSAGIRTSFEQVARSPEVLQQLVDLLAGPAAATRGPDRVP